MIQQSALPFKLKRGQERITSRSGLALYAEFMKAMKVRALIDGYFPPAGSGHSYSASAYIIPISLMLYGGGESIEDVREIRGDAPLRKVSGLTGIPGVSAMGDWWRRMGGRSGVAALERVNERLFCEIMRRDRGNDYTLIVDPTLIEAGKRETHMTYLGYKGYRPVVATIKEVGTVVAYEFKEGTWKPFRTRDGVMTDREIAQTIHITEKGKASFRLIVLRWRENQGELFRNNYRYHCLATNMLEQSKAEMVWTYNERASIENHIKEIKCGFGMERMPSGDFQGNAVHFGIGMMTYHLFIAQKFLTMPADWKNKTIKSIRWLLVETAGKLIEHGRMTILKIAAGVEKYLMFLSMRKRNYELMLE